MTFGNKIDYHIFRFYESSFTDEGMIQILGALLPNKVMETLRYAHVKNIQIDGRKPSKAPVAKLSTPTNKRTNTYLFRLFRFRLILNSKLPVHVNVELMLRNFSYLPHL